MKSIAHEIGQRMLVLAVMLCLFVVIFAIGVAAVLKTAVFDKRFSRDVEAAP